MPSVRHIVIARSEYRGWPPRDLRRGAAQCFRASPVIQTVKSPRFRRLSLYPHQFVTRYFFFANLCRREVLNLCGIKHIRGRGRDERRKLPVAPEQNRQTVILKIPKLRKGWPAANAPWHASAIWKAHAPGCAPKSNQVSSFAPGH